jgi:type IV/VI secretion system ImpK/VasF family protein
MTDAYAALVMPLFRRVLDLVDRLDGGETATLDEVMARVRHLIEDTDKRALLEESLKRSYSMARYGLVAWIDEVLTQSSWGRSAGWGYQDHCLEFILYDTRVRYERFYEWSHRAEDELRRNLQGSVDALETYLLSVTLGFRGNLGKDLEGFNAWVGRVYELVSQGTDLPDRPFPDDTTAPAPLRPLDGPRLLLIVSALIALTTVITLAGYIFAVTYVYEYSLG